MYVKLRHELLLHKRFNITFKATWSMSDKADMDPDTVLVKEMKRSNCYPAKFDTTKCFGRDVEVAEVCSLPNSQWECIHTAERYCSGRLCAKDRGQVSEEPPRSTAIDQVRLSKPIRTPRYSLCVVVKTTECPAIRTFSWRVMHHYCQFRL